MCMYGLQIPHPKPGVGRQSVRGGHQLLRLFLPNPGPTTPIRYTHSSIKYTSSSVRYTYSSVRYTRMEC